MHNSPWQISLSFIFQQPHKLYDIFVQRGVYVMRVFLLLIHSAIRIRMQIWCPAASHTHIWQEREKEWKGKRKRGKKRGRKRAKLTRIGKQELPLSACAFYLRLLKGLAGSGIFDTTEQKLKPNTSGSRSKARWKYTL